MAGKSSLCGSQELLSLLLQGINLIIFSNCEILSQAENSREYFRWQQDQGSDVSLS